MRVRWHGHSAFTLSGESATVVIDPFGDMSALRERGRRFDYPAIEAPRADLVIVTHEHADHNGVEVVGGDPPVVRSTAGRHASPVGEVVAVASEHDEQAGTARGPNAVMCFALDGLRVCHFGDFGQRELRAEQREAIGAVDLLFLPVGGGLTIGGEQAAGIAMLLAPRWVVPMHYRTGRVDFLQPADAFLEQLGRVERIAGPAYETGELPEGGGPVAVVPEAP